MPRKIIDFDAVQALASALPRVEWTTIRGAPALKVQGTLLCWPALHRSAEPDTLAIRMPRAERADLIAANPDTYYVTDHYLSYSIVLVRLSQIDRPSLKKLLRAAWTSVATRPKPVRARRSKS